MPPSERSTSSDEVRLGAVCRGGDGTERAGCGRDVLLAGRSPAGTIGAAAAASAADACGSGSTVIVVACAGAELVVGGAAGVIVPVVGTAAFGAGVVMPAESGNTGGMTGAALWD